MFPFYSTIFELTNFLFTINDIKYIKLEFPYKIQYVFKQNILNSIKAEKTWKIHCLMKK